MLFVRSISNSPFYNLAAEEFFLKNSTEEVFMLWLSEPSVVVGKHQNAMAEINYPYIVNNNIRVARRLSGGGTVVHDMQNLNFTFIANGEPGKLINFKKFVLPVIDYLKTLGINARIGEKNDILIGDLKISGNAEHIYKTRILHHGTLLFNSDLTRLKLAIKTKTGRYIDKAVQSNRAVVTNIADHLQTKISIEDIILGLSNYIVSTAENVKYHYILPEEGLAIEKLANEKYSTEEWIFGYSPKYTFQNKFDFDGFKWKIQLEVERGIIQEAFLSNNQKEFNSLGANLVGVVHLYEPVLQILEKNSPEFVLFDKKEIINNFF